MYPYPLPHTITNILGEELTFESIVLENDEKKMIVSNKVKPGCGPAMHVHFKQDESLTVIKGKLGYKIQGQEDNFIGPGETIIFKRGQAHKFWNAGEEDLECTGWLKPANTTDYFLSALYNSVNKSGKPEGDPFDGAYLITKYKSEYDVPAIPGFVKKVIMPLTVFTGKILGKYKHFRDSPDPI